MARSIEIYDTTLRDGSQGLGIHFSVADKLRVAQELERFGVTYIDFPAGAGRDELDAVIAKAKAAGLTTVVFDRAGRRYHGTVKSFAEAARQAGLTF